MSIDLYNLLIRFLAGSFSFEELKEAIKNLADSGDKTERELIEFLSNERVYEYRLMMPFHIAKFILKSG